MDRLIHTPEGVRDVYNQECTKKLYLENQIEQVFHAFGYQDIETPTFEFFDVFGREVGTTPSRELYKFFDRDGNTLVLRPDFTPSIARAASMYFMEETMPIRLCYRGSSFVNSSSYQGRLKESTQMGVELLNDDSAMADAEIIAMTVKVMLDAGLTDFQISIGHVGFFQALAEEAALAEDVLNELKELISIKNHFGAEELLAKQNLRSDLFEALRDVPQLFGNAEILEKAKGLTRNSAAREALDRLATIYEIVKDYGYEKYVFFDLGLLSKFHYYTGIIFQAYTYGTGEPIVKGGRYDALLQHNQQIRVATKYPNIAKDYFYNRKHQTVEMIKLNGSIELAPIVGLSEVIVDIVETGSTLRENGLTVLEEVCPLSARMVVNQVSMRMENERITKLIQDLKGALV